jgi:hypothetical protein
MIIHKTFLTSLDEHVVRELISADMEGRGFTPHEDSTALIFSRGTKKASASFLYAEDWLCKVSIEFTHADKLLVNATYDIFSKRPIVLPWEKLSWNRELFLLESSITEGEIAAGQKAATETIKAFGKYVLRNIIIILTTAVFLCAIPCGVLVLGIMGIGFVLQHIFNISESDGLFIGTFAWIPVFIVLFAQFIRHESKITGK